MAAKVLILNTGPNKDEMILPQLALQVAKDLDVDPIHIDLLKLTSRTVERNRQDIRKYSDLDIYCKEKMKRMDLIELKMELEDSNIIIKVDVLDIDSCSSEFREIIEQDLVEIR